MLDLTTTVVEILSQVKMKDLMFKYFWHILGIHLNICLRITTQFNTYDDEEEEERKLFRA